MGKEKSSINQILAKIDDSGSIWVAYAALGIVEKYSSDGELLKTVNLNDRLSEHVRTLIVEKS